MKKVYFDQNTWQEIINNLSIDDLKKRLRSKKLEICLSMHNIYEFGKCFTASTKNIELGKKIFQYFKNLRVNCIINLTQNLIHSDITYATTGGRLLLYLNRGDTIRVNKNISDFSEGQYKNARHSIEARERKLRQFIENFGKTIRNINRERPSPSSFKEFRDDWPLKRDIIMNSEFSNELKNISDTKLFSEPSKYPFINTYINGQLYFNYIALKNYNAPSNRRFSDYLHLIDANAANLFVTNDQRLLKISKEICPFITLNNLKELNL